MVRACFFRLSMQTNRQNIRDSPSINQWRIQDFQGRAATPEGKFLTSYLAQYLLKIAWKWMKLDQEGCANLQRYSQSHQIVCRRQECSSETVLPFTVNGHLFLFCMERRVTMGLVALWIALFAPPWIHHWLEFISNSLKMKMAVCEALFALVDKQWTPFSQIHCRQSHYGAIDKAKGDRSPHSRLKKLCQLTPKNGSGIGLVNSAVM